jgi:hypothetical protein
MYRAYGRTDRKVEDETSLSSWPYPCRYCSNFRARLASEHPGT